VIDEGARVRVELPAFDAASGEPRPGVGLVTIDRPAVLNALDRRTIEELVAALASLDADPDCRCIVITGAGERAFVAGADIGEMAEQTAASMRAGGPFAQWDRIAAIATPMVAAVRGYALGGGCELALACDLVVAADDATFGQPEITLGIMPGLGGTQRLARTIGRARTMELVLTGRRLPAAEAYQMGLVSQLVPAAETLPVALSLAARIAAAPPLAVAAAMRAIDGAFEGPLVEGMALERELFHELFDTQDQKEGMRAFREKRRPTW